ncbi:MAG: translation initiation factor [Candidatus Woesearchaeota archaeon]
MTEMCLTCGLPKDLCVCQDIAKEDQNVVVFLEKKKFGKESTIIDGIDAKVINIKDVTKDLKSKFACGGTFKDNRIELQGNHLKKVKEELIKLGFDPSQIQVK